MNTNNKNSKITDLASALKETGYNVGSTIIGQVILEGVAGTVVPGVTTAMLSYKQKRAERNILELYKQLKQKMDDLDVKLKSITSDRLSEIKEKFLPIVFDYVLDEKQLDKIKFMATGLYNIIQKDIDHESRVIEYYDILESLTVIEIQTLVDACIGKVDFNQDWSRSYYNDKNYLEETDLTIDDFINIRSKLENMRLIISNREEEIAEKMRVLSMATSNRSPIIGDMAPQIKYRISKRGQEITRFIYDLYFGQSDEA